MRRLLVAALAAIVVGLTIVSAGSATRTDETPYTCDKQQVRAHHKSARVTINRAYAKKRWKHGPGKGQKRKIKWHIKCNYFTPTDWKIRKYWKKKAQKAGPYRLYRHMARYKCNFSHSDLNERGKHPANGRYYGLSCGVVCGESRGSFYPYPNAIDGYGQWIASSWSRWVGFVRGTGIEKKLERKFGVSLTFGSRAGHSSPLEQHVIAHYSNGNDTWYGWNSPSNCR